MLSKARLWIRRYLKEMILAISLALLVGLGIPLALRILGIDIATPIIWYPCLGLCLLSFVFFLLSCFQRKIPLSYVQQRIHPSRWVSAEVGEIDYGRYDSEINPKQVYYESMTVNLISDLPFNIDFESLSGKLVVNGYETKAMLVVKDDIFLPKKSKKEIQWAIYGFVDSNVMIVHRNFPHDIEKDDEYIVRFTGRDSKGRKYQFKSVEK